MPETEPGYDPLANGERGYALYCEILRLRHEAAASRRIGAAALRLAAIAREIGDILNLGDHANAKTTRVPH